MIESAYTIDDFVCSEVITPDEVLKNLPVDFADYREVISEFLSAFRDNICYCLLTKGAEKIEIEFHFEKNVLASTNPDYKDSNLVSGFGVALSRDSGLEIIFLEPRLKS